MKQSLMITLLLCVSGLAQADSSFSNCSPRTKNLVKDAVDFSIVNFNKIQNFATTKEDIGTRSLSKIRKALNSVSFTCVKKSSSKCRKGAMSQTSRKNTIYLCEQNIKQQEYDQMCALSGMIMYDLAHMNGIRKSMYHNSSNEHKRRRDKAYPLEYASMITCYESLGMM